VILCAHCTSVAAAQNVAFDTFFECPSVSAEDLAQQRGRADQQLDLMSVDGAVHGNTATNSINGQNLITSGSFANAMAWLPPSRIPATMYSYKKPPYVPSKCANRFRSSMRLAAIVAGFFFCFPANAASLVLTGILGNASVSVSSLHDLKYRTIVRQQYDFSCGSAAIATLLTYHYEHQVTEQEVLLAMFERGNRAAIRRDGFSLLDMQQYLQTIGYSADGIYASLDDLTRVGIPAIVLIQKDGYKHFVVIKGVNVHEVLVGDPAAGLKRYSRAEFANLWTNGILFVVRSRPDVARSHFNGVAQWSVVLRAPISDAVARDSLTNVTVLRPSRGDF
jgi:predicted double-glycine peptidase